MNAVQPVAHTPDEVRLFSIVQNSMDAIITIDITGQILIFNHTAEEVFGYTVQQALGMHLGALLPHAFRTAHEEHVKRFAQSGATSRKMGGSTTLYGLRANGEQFPLEASISRSVDREAVLLTVIVRDISERMKTQQQLKRAQMQLRELSLASQTAREQEKARISRELHDELGQSLTALKMDLAWLQTQTTNTQEPAVAERIKTMQNMLDSTVAATRRIAADLRPLILDDLGLLAALEWITQDFSRRTSIRCHLHVEDAMAQIDTRIQSALYRAVQEVLTNVARHAHATNVTIDLTQNEAGVHLCMRDDGCGMTLEDQKKHNSFGLLGMRERVYILGGTMLIESTLGSGTCITLNMPLAPDGVEPVSVGDGP
jgi:two-component system, NarL family, sensor histidine kinase UhpB